MNSSSIKLKMIVTILVMIVVLSYVFQIAIPYDNRFSKKISKDFFLKEEKNQNKNVIPRVTLSINQWDNINVIHGEESDEMCAYHDLVRDGIFLNSKMCLRHPGDLVSDAVRGHGTWGECNNLKIIWSKEFAKLNDTDKKKSVLLDVGANIGACTMEFLPLGVKVYSFEPSPNNLFYLTSSFLANAKFDKNNFRLYPIGLGNDNTDMYMSYEKGNQGNSILGNHTGMHAIASKIQVRKLDDVLSDEDIIIPLLKIDAQGFESNILKGAKKWLASGRVKSIYTEFSSGTLKYSNSSGRELVNILKSHNYATFIWPSAALTDTYIDEQDKLAEKSKIMLQDYVDIVSYLN